MGLIADWRIISGDEAFFEATKAIHNGLQGSPDGLSQAQRDTYLANARRNAEQLEERYDFVVVHGHVPPPIRRRAGAVPGSPWTGWALTSLLRPLLRRSKPFTPST